MNSHDAWYALRRKVEGFKADTSEPIPYTIAMRQVLYEMDRLVPFKQLSPGQGGDE